MITSQLFTYPRAGALITEPPPVAVSAVAGAPGYYLPSEAIQPVSISSLSSVTPVPLTAWTAGQYVPTADGNRAHWNGTSWALGAVPGSGDLQPGDPGWVAPRSVGDYPGVYDRKTIPPDASSNTGWGGRFIRGDYIKGAVIEVTHAELEPNGPGIVANNDIDKALQAMEGTHSNGTSYTLGIKIRVLMGVRTAQWLKNLGEFVMSGYWDLQNGTVHGCPAIYWPDFVAEHVAFRERFAEKYGSDDRIVDVAFEGPMNVFAEWYIQQTAKQSATSEVKCHDGVYRLREDLAQQNRNKLMANGYTFDLELQAFRQLVATCDLFEMSSSSALNPVQYLDAAGNPQQSLPWTMAREAEMEALIGHRSTLGNNSMRADATWPKGSPSALYEEMWGSVRDSAGAKYYQTANTTLIQTNGGDLYVTCLKACEMGAWMIEVPGNVGQYTNYSTSWGMTPAQFDEINALCAQNVIDYPFKPILH